MSSYHEAANSEHRHTPRAKLHNIPIDILDDLGSRFIINVPEGQRDDLIRICFQIELAHWFYIDEYATNPKYKPLKLRECFYREFFEHMLNHVGFLRVHLDNIDVILEEFRVYKLNVPTYGAIILNPDLSKVLIVCSWWSRTSWGFPKGKVNELEAPEKCAIREVMEEIGFDISSRLNPRQYICKEIMGQKSCLYLIPGVSEDTHFEPRTKREIRNIQWFPVAGLPNFRKEELSDDPRLNPLSLTANCMFMIQPFVPEIRLWIARYLNPGGRNGRKQSRNSRSTSARGGGSTSNFQAVEQQHPPQQHQAAAAAADTDPDIRLTPDFVPKAWSGFKLLKKSLMGAIESTPGWVRSKPRGSN